MGCLILIFDDWFLMQEVLNADYKNSDVENICDKYTDVESNTAVWSLARRRKFLSVYAFSW